MKKQTKTPMRKAIKRSKMPQDARLGGRLKEIPATIKVYIVVNKKGKYTALDVFSSTDLTVMRGEEIWKAKIVPVKRIK